MSSSLCLPDRCDRNTPLCLAFLYDFLESKRRSSCLYSKTFAHWHSQCWPNGRRWMLFFSVTFPCLLTTISLARCPSAFFSLVLTTHVMHHLSPFPFLPFSSLHCLSYPSLPTTLLPMSLRLFFPFLIIVRSCSLLRVRNSTSIFSNSFFSACPILRLSSALVSLTDFLQILRPCSFLIHSVSLYSLVSVISFSLLVHQLFTDQ